MQHLIQHTKFFAKNNYTNFKNTMRNIEGRKVLFMRIGGAVSAFGASYIATHERVLLDNCEFFYLKRKVYNNSI